MPIADDDQLVLERRQRVGAEEGAGDDRQGIEEPEAEDRFERERPVGEPASGPRVRHHEHWLLSCPKTPAAQTAACPLAEAPPQPVETRRGSRNAVAGSARYPGCNDTARRCRCE